MMLLEQFENYKTVKLSESNRQILRDALEYYRNAVTVSLYTEGNEYEDIELLEIDEILNTIGDN